jgi:hypothetical protein
VEGRQAGINWMMYRNGLIYFPFVGTIDSGQELDIPFPTQLKL